MIGAAPLQIDPTAIASGVNTIWVLTVSFLIFFMQPGFALLEAGQVRSKNVANVLMKNMMDWGVGVLTYFLVGAGIATVAAGLTSSGAFSFAEAFAYINDPGGWVGWLFGAVFAMTAATIVSGAVAERIKFKAYVFCIVVFTAIIYPVTQGITWSGGLLAGSGFLGAALGVGYLDFAGATVVHMLGGVAGLTGAWVLGARNGRFDVNGNSQPIPGHSITFAVLGTLILCFGWYGFNVGTQATVLAAAEGGLTFNGAALGRVALNTTLGMGAGGVFAALATSFTEGKPDPLFTANGMLAGLVAVTGAVPHVTWWGGLALGVIAGIQTPIVYRWVVDALKVDDVCGVFAVHGSAGAIGTFLIPVFAVAGFSMTQLLMQGVGVIVIALWAVVATYVTFKVAEVTMGLRVSDEDEFEGLDRSEHGSVAYPEFVETGSGSAPSGSQAVATDGGEAE